MGSDKKIKIFIVEDDADLSRAWSRLLELKGYEYSLYENASSALEAQDLIKNFDVFITDYYLPDSNGIDLAKEMRKHCQIPFILLTGSKEEAVSHEASKVEDLHVLHKPIRFQALEDQIKKLIRR